MQLRIREDYVDNFLSSACTTNRNILDLVGYDWFTVKPDSSGDLLIVKDDQELARHYYIDRNEMHCFDKREDSSVASPIAGIEITEQLITRVEASITFKDGFKITSANAQEIMSMIKNTFKL